MHPMKAPAPWVKLAKHADLTAAAGSSALDPAPAADCDGGRLLRATRALRLGDWQAASSLLSQEAEENPGSYLTMDLRAACWLQAGLHEQALDDAMLCTKINPDWARGWARLGAAQLCLGHARAAVAAYRRGLGLDPNSREMQVGLGMAEEAQAEQRDKRKTMRH